MVEIEIRDRENQKGYIVRSRRKVCWNFFILFQMTKFKKPFKFESLLNL